MEAASKAKPLNTKIINVKFGCLIYKLHARLCTSISILAMEANCTSYVHLTEAPKLSATSL